MPAHQFHLDGVLEIHDLPAHVGLRAADRQKIVGEPAAFLTPIDVGVLTLLGVEDLGTAMDVRVAAGYGESHNTADTH